MKFYLKYALNIKFKKIIKQLSELSTSKLVKLIKGNAYEMWEMIL